MKRLLFGTAFVLCQSAFGQNFDNLNANLGLNKSITWHTSSYGSGFGHKIYNHDPGYHTDLRIAARHNSSSWTDIMTITTQGRIGIGSTNPTAKLEIYQYDGVSKTRIYTNQHAGTAKLEIAGGVASFGSLYSGWTIKHSHNNTNRDLYFGYGLTEETKVVFSDEGNVGIGITNPTHKLTVDGVISAKEVKVSTTPNSDCVFESDYPLLPLSEVEAHIKERKHLPGIPSAEQFKENGVGLGEMDDMLLRKVEELTLYVIEQSKRIEKLEEENSTLRNELNDIKFQTHDEDEK